MSYSDYAMKTEVLNGIMKKRVPDDANYAFFCNKYLSSKHPGGTAGSMGAIA